MSERSFGLGKATGKRIKEMDDKRAGKFTKVYARMRSKAKR